jgi:hypothetical protein
MDSVTQGCLCRNARLRLLLSVWPSVCGIQFLKFDSKNAASTIRLLLNNGRPERQLLLRCQQQRHERRGLQRPTCSRWSPVHSDLQQQNEALNQQAVAWRERYEHTCSTAMNHIDTRNGHKEALKLQLREAGLDPVIEPIVPAEAQPSQQEWLGPRDALLCQAQEYESPAN